MREEPEPELVEEEVEPRRAIARRRVHEPAPDHARRDERHRHREEVDRPEHALALHALVEQERERRADDQRSGDERDREEQRVVEVDDPGRDRCSGCRLPAGRDGANEVARLEPTLADGKSSLYALVSKPARLLRLTPVGERDLDVPADEPVDEDRHEDESTGRPGATLVPTVESSSRHRLRPARPSRSCRRRVPMPFPIYEFFVRRLHERSLELRHVLALQEQTESGADVGRPRAGSNDAVRERSRQRVGLPVLERRLEVRRRTASDSRPSGPGSSPSPG